MQMLGCMAIQIRIVFKETVVSYIASILYHFSTQPMIEWSMDWRREVMITRMRKRKGIDTLWE